MKGQHYIQKQVFDFEFSAKSRALQWQRSMSLDGWLDIAAILSSHLDRYDDGEDYMIDRLVLDLGDIYEADIRQKIGEVLKTTLPTFLTKPAAHKKRIDQTEFRIMDDTRMVEGGKALFTSFVYFLHNGIIPWYAEVSSLAHLERLVADKWPPKTLSGLLMAENTLHVQHARARMYYQFSAPFAKRIIETCFDAECRELENILTLSDRVIRAQVPSAPAGMEITAKRDYVLQWMALEALDAPETWAAQFAISHLKIQFKALGIEVGEQVNRALRGIDFKDKKKRELEMEFLHVIRELKENSGGKSEKARHGAPAADHLLEQEDQEPGDRSIGNVPDDPKVPPRITGSSTGSEKTRTYPPNTSIRAFGGDTTKGVPEAARQELKEAFKKTGRSSPEPARTGDQSPAPAIEKDVHPLPPTEARSASKQRKSPERKAFPEIAGEPMETIQVGAGEEFYITHGGLVLTWPYLSQMFLKLHYIAGRQFISEAKRERAVLLLGFIATGDAECEEPLLPLAKFLCGWPLKMPVRKALALTEGELDEARTMLRSLISNWSILKKTSIEGLRETFFVREAKLQFEEDHWKLTVEQKGTDILLDHLPYTLSMVKLPWLKHLLQVDWA